MNIERMESGAKATFNILKLTGAAIVAAGVILLVAALGDLNKVASDGHHPATSEILFKSSPMILLIALGLVQLAIAAALQPITLIIFRNISDGRYRFDQLLSAVEQQKILMESLKETASLSDASKQIAFRQKDREALRAAIQEDLQRGDTDSALQLVGEMERRFGSKRETETLRDQIETGQRDAITRQVRDAVEHIDQTLGRFDWSAAQREAEKLVRQLPNHPDVRRLPERVQTAKDAHKRELLKQWKDAVARDDVDRSVELLKHLDQYISPSEAEAYKEAARDVFKKKLQQLGVQFALHAHDKNHIEAFRIAQQIVEEFPNSRMAAELKERMDILAERAHQPAGV
jgi:hypothetical protein